ncbi:MAG: hypothetical protein WBM24_12415, partial [Candidatus Sulfotelmatobacter sp.]
MPRREGAPPVVGSPLTAAEGIVGRYRPAATALLEKHGLTVPPATLDMLARTIMRCRELGPRQKRAKGQQLSPRDRLRRASTHAAKLLKYSERGSSRHDSIPKRAKALRTLLNLEATVWLATASVRVNAPELLERLQANALDRPALESLVMAIDSILARDDDAVTGRPPNRLASVLNACCIVWLRARRPERFTWNEPQDRLDGPLADFVRDVLCVCRFESLKDAAMKQALVRRLPD